MVLVQGVMVRRMSRRYGEGVLVVMGSLMMDQDGFETWKVNKRGTEHEGWIAVFNRRAKKSKFDISPERMGLDSESYGLMEVWSDDAKPFGRTTTLNPHGVLFVKFTSK